MDSTSLLEWLVNEKNMSIRSAKDVISRCGRVCRMLNVTSIDSMTLDNLLNNEEFDGSSMFVKSQLKRAITLSLEFDSKTKEKENTLLPMLRKQYADIQRGIDNLLNAIQQGIVTPSTKQRLEDLEKQKSDISVQIVKEEMSKPLLTKEQILFWLHRSRKYNTRRLEHKRRLIDSFINTIYLYDDKMVITFNYKDGSETVSLSEIENSDLSSDLTVSALPKNDQSIWIGRFLLHRAVGTSHDRRG